MNISMLSCRIVTPCLYMLFCIKFTQCLYPKESPTREIKTLDGIWNFKICHQSDQDIGFREKWFMKPLEETGDVIPMPVPSSYNDITQNKTIRDYLGWAWYDYHFYVPERWKAMFRVLVRFGSAHYIAHVFLNGVPVVNHTGGHLPFEADVTKILNYSDINRITVALNNTLSKDTIPQGSKNFKSGSYPPGFYSQSTNFDFFNYAGIHRSVVLYTTPLIYVEDIILATHVENSTGVVKYDVSINSVAKNSGISESKCLITVLDKQQKPVAQTSGCTGVVKINNPILWWPFTMHFNPGYQYTLKVKLYSNNTSDVYFQKFGIRSISVKGTQLFINNEPFYFMGFGKHEDSNIRGKGLDLPLIIKDFNLIKWIGANSFRTSHYPYAEELMDQADDQGIVVIDECPAVGLQSFSNTLLQLHRQMIQELIRRDKNRPSVIAWSVANEPKSSDQKADAYFKNIVEFAKKMDQSRPVTAALNADHSTDKAGKYLDIIMINHYYSWYQETGSTEVIIPLLVNDISQAFKIYKKPIMMSEYGAASVAGLHMDPPFVFTEDYQVEVMVQHHQAFDILRQKGFFIGEHIWNFADFLTQQEITRVVGNKKGIFTRDRQPKASARLLRCRYHKVANRTINDGVAYCPELSSKNNLFTNCDTDF